MIYAVIGANLGDCGKGLIVDALVRRMSIGREPPLVVRHNGGAQAGHTVVDGARRHVFGHVGSGTFAGAPTHLTADFISNPTLLARELKKLGELGFSPQITVDPHSPITTPFEMIINQALDFSRGSSCGVGINETIVRERNDGGPNLMVYDLVDRPGVFGKDYQRVKHEWFPARCEELYIDAAAELQSSAIDAHEWEFQEALNIFAKAVKLKDDDDAIKDHDDIIFEGAQGLMLDQTRGYFPMVTRSNTGLRNPMQLCQVDRAIYVTRWYLTRHGFGPMQEDKFSCGGLPYKDKTNDWNKFQGRFKTGLLNTVTLRDRTFLDTQIWMSRRDRHPPEMSLAVTHLDQTIDGLHEFRSFENEISKLDSNGFLAHLAGLGFDVPIWSAGSAYKDVYISNAYL